MKSSEVRQKIRNNEFNEPTCGFATGFTQTNLVIVEKDYADDFELFCKLNPKPCPLIERLEVGSYEAKKTTPGSDLRTDLVYYKKFVDGEYVETKTDLLDEWKEDLVGFLIGCSFTFESALHKERIYMPHYVNKGNVAMYKSSIKTNPSSFFAGPLVVSMRWIPEDKINQVVEITGKFPEMHGSPVHIGESEEIGISNLKNPDFGEYWEKPDKDDVSVFWACGVTPQLALNNAKIPLAYTHSPGFMFLTDIKDEAFEVNIGKA